MQCFKNCISDFKSNASSFEITATNSSNYWTIHSTNIIWRVILIRTNAERVLDFWVRALVVLRVHQICPHKLEPIRAFGLFHVKSFVRKSVTKVPAQKLTNHSPWNKHKFGDTSRIPNSSTPKWPGVTESRRGPNINPVKPTEQIKHFLTHAFLVQCTWKTY